MLKGRKAAESVVCQLSCRVGWMGTGWQNTGDLSCSIAARSSLAPALRRHNTLTAHMGFFLAFIIFLKIFFWSPYSCKLSKAFLYVIIIDKCI